MVNGLLSDKIILYSKKKYMYNLLIIQLSIQFFSDYESAHVQKRIFEYYFLIRSTPQKSDQRIIRIFSFSLTACTYVYMKFYKCIFLFNTWIYLLILEYTIMYLTMCENKDPTNFMINVKVQKHKSQVAITENFGGFSCYLKFQQKRSCIWEYFGSEFADFYAELNELHYINQKLCGKSKI